MASGPSPQSSHAYRPDVDGLRAIAVLAVLGYHAFPSVLPGGFAGVDVFFVISGYLITGIIREDLERGRFTYQNFYWRRIRRIFPALVLVLTSCLALGWLVLLPDEYAQLGKHVAAGAGFVSNIALWREAGYFDSAAELKPLLHLWSLGVEEQYYLVWPLLLLFFRRHALWMIAGLGAASFIMNIWMVGSHPTAAFYLPVTRFWELLVGSLLAFSLKKNYFGNEKSLVGLILVAAGFALLHPDRAFPGWWALLPVLGTALLVSAGPQAWVNRRILSHPAMVFVGLISYPLYLWHWPLLTFARIVQGGEPSVPARLALLGTSMLLAWLTYELVEKRIRFSKKAFLSKTTVPALAAAMSLLLVVGLAAFQARLVPESASDPAIVEISRASADWGYGAETTIRGDSPRAVLFFGDSHMQHYLPRIERVMRERAAPVRTVLFKTEGGCAPVPGIERKSQKCAAFVEDGFATAMSPAVDTVVIAASWVGFISRPDYYRTGDESRATIDVQSPWVLQGFEQRIARLVTSGKRVVLVLSSPRGEAFDPKSAIGRGWVHLRISHPFKPADRTRQPIDARLREIAARAGATVLDPADWLCGPKLCPTADEAGRPLYKDDSHLRASFARRLEALDGYVYLEKRRSGATTGVAVRTPSAS
jgi:peptidoglycan/LPS O-acetylase OafA/YrhL